MTTHSMPHLSPSRAVAHTLRLALQYHSAGFLLQAAELYAEICAIDPLNADARFLLGVLARQACKFKQAAELVAQAIKLDPRQGRFRRELQLICTLAQKSGVARHTPGRTSAPTAAADVSPSASSAHLDFAKYAVWIAPRTEVIAGHAAHA